MSPEQWAELLARLDDPGAGQVAEALADARDMSVGHAMDVVEDALAEGGLIEDTEESAWGTVRLPEGVDAPDTDDEDEPAQDGAHAEEGDETTTAPATTDAADSWDGVAFTDPVDGQWPPAMMEREQWMGRQGKLPFAPWADPDAPAPCSKNGHTNASECDCDARYKWGYDGLYADAETVALAEDDPRLDGRVFIQLDADPFAFVDGDDVRCPETGEVHPEFVRLLEEFGFTYADVSTSGSGVHAYYTGELPNEQSQAVFDIDDEPWGENDTAPTVEIYAGKHVNVATGQRVGGTPLDVVAWDDDALRAVLDEYDALKEPTPTHDTDRERDDLDDYEPSASGSDETTDEIRDVLKAVDGLRPRDVRLRTSKVAEDGTGWEKWDPSSYRTSSGNDSLHRPAGETVFYDQKHGEGFGLLSLLAAEEGIISNPWDRLDGEEWWQAVEAARDQGAPIPEYVGGGDGGEPVSTLPLEHLERLDTEEARRYAKKRGMEWPSTSEARDRLERRLFTALRAQEKVVVDAPTSLGKSYTVATTPWLARTNVTGGSPVIHFSETREARDDAADKSANASRVTHAKLLGRTEACPVAAGRHDPAKDDEDDDPDVVLTMDGMPASEWFEAVCEGRGVPFSVAHTYLAEHNDQDAELPCCEDDLECRAIAQWEGLPRTEDGEAAVDVIHATHQFAHVPSLRNGTNLIFDERPEFTADLSQDRIRRAVTAFLKETEAPVGTFEELVADSRSPQSPKDDVVEALEAEPDREWYLQADGAHTLAPALARAVYRAQDGGNGRRAATVPHDPPRLDATANDGDSWNREYVTVVLDEDNTVRTVRTAPSFASARSVVGLDAHPTPTLWQRNVDPNIQPDTILSGEERRLWRRFERGKIVVQVGEADRPLASGEYFNGNLARETVRHLREHYGEDFRTAITASSVEADLAGIMEEVGIDDPNTMHYGEEKSRNDFGDESVGYLEGCIDPGDDYVLDLLAEAGLDAAPETRTVDGETHRAHGRGFVGEDADTAAALLASVRENHVAQAAGRYARNADDPDDRAIVFVHTAAVPAGFVDYEIPDVAWVASEKQRTVAEALRARPGATAKELAEETGVSKRHVAKTLSRLADAGAVDVREGVGDYGADVYKALAGEQLTATGGVADLGTDKIANTPVWNTYTWSFAISTTDDVDGGSDGAPPAATESPDGSQSHLGAFEPGG